MSLSYDVSLLDHLAEHMIFLFTAPSFWYSLNLSYDHGFHLSHHLGMTPHDYERLLAAANLAHYYPKWGFTISVDRWKMFLDGHHFYSSNGTGSFELDTKRLDLDAFILGTSAQHRVRVHVIQIGVSTNLSPIKIEWQKDSQGRMMSTPPRLNGLLLQQLSLRNIMDPFLWKYVLEKGLEEDSANLAR